MQFRIEFTNECDTGDRILVVARAIEKVQDGIVRRVQTKSPARLEVVGIDISVLYSTVLHNVLSQSANQEKEGIEGTVLNKHGHGLYTRYCGIGARCGLSEQGGAVDSSDSAQRRCRCSLISAG